MRKILLLALAVTALTSCTTKTEDPSTMTVEQRRELLMQSDNDTLASKVYVILDKIQPYLSEPLSKAEYKEVADSIIQLGDSAEIYVKIIGMDVDKILKARKHGQFFDETITPTDTIELSHGYGIVFFSGYTRKLGKPDALKDADDRVRKMKI